MTTTTITSGLLGRAVAIIVTPTLTVAGAYSSGDYIGTSGVCMTFTGAAAYGNGSGTIIGATLIDAARQSIATELWLFSEPVTPPNDNAAWTISDAEAKKCIGVIPFSTWYASALNSVSQGTIPNGNIPFVCPANIQDLYGVLIPRGTPTLADGDLTVRILVAKD